MAYIQKSGSRYTVRHGVSGQVLSTFGSLGKAQVELKRLHAKNKPTAAHRGQSAKAAVNAGKKKMNKGTGKKRGRRR